jgi:hypothetical protein
MLGDKQKILGKHVLVEVLKNFHTRETEIDQAKISNAIARLAYTSNRVPNIYNTNEGWVVKKMRLEYANRIVVILLIIY